MAKDLEEQLREAGIDVDAGWRGSAEPGARTAPLPSTLERQRVLLAKVRDILTGQIEADRAKVAELREKLARLRHGGGH